MSSHFCLAPSSERAPALHRSARAISARSRWFSSPLAPGEVKIVNLTPALAESHVPADANWATVVLAYLGTPGDLVPIAVSYDATGRYGQQTPFFPGLSFAWKGGQWEVTPMHDTLMTVGNGSDKETSATVTLFYDGGTKRYDLPPRKLKPGGQAFIDFGDLIRNQTPDANGHVLPADITSGSYEINEVGALTVGHLYESKLHIDKRFGHATYGCATCCAYSGAYLWPNPLAVATNSGDFVKLYATNSCGGDVDMTYQAYGWSSWDSSIATVNEGEVLGYSPGSTHIYASIDLQFQDYYQFEGGSNCYSQMWTPNSQVNVYTPTAVITLSFTGPKTAGDNLRFEDTITACGESLGPHDCTAKSVWSWNFEGKITVNDDASYWTLHQSLDNFRSKGYCYSNGVLQSFDDVGSNPNDGPSVLQLTPYQAVGFWIDSPGHRYTRAGCTIDQLIQVQNFSTNVCSTKTPTACYTATWYVKTVVTTGGHYDTNSSTAGLGSMSTNF